MNEDKQRLYVSPEAEVIETEIKTVLCQSTANTNIGDMPETDMDINF